jgi:3-deoxy-D-manno-octulosonic-acid transferase
VIKTYDELKQKFPNTKLIIAPRHLERVKEIEQILSRYNYSFGYRSKGDDFRGNEIIILDTLGELKKAYAFSDIAFIGGSFNKTGGHNPLEATIYDVPTITGPSIKNFRDIYSILTNAKASSLVTTQKELFTTLERLISDEEYYNQTKDNCHKIFQSQQGALDFVINKIKETI